MARALEPGEVGRIWISGESGEGKPCLLAKAPSTRQLRQLHKDWNDSYTNKNWEQHHEAVEKMFFDWVVGWEGYGAEFGPDAVGEKFTLDGMREAVRAVIACGLVQMEDKKK